MFLTFIEKVRVLSVYLFFLVIGSDSKVLNTFSFLLFSIIGMSGNGIKLGVWSLVLWNGFGGVYSKEGLYNSSSE